ncbi:YbaB/EbfC family DNA-binding protein [Actinokineospora diospyrosa]|uniref:YbaB/EbfC DNA-binding family protein n=1 Tax=Actinokineospora diospyrosa TaxID=103728 RepID=A0ABT1I8L0_9PSEU|nr:YbaB/EbfC family DNA-binding protein [Actinokineospora diospyrosa]MCP2268958.1 hypothetical protein [Actinokineospora diospyrosa]
MTGQAHSNGVEATVHPGGILSRLSLTESALRRPDLAELILRVVDQATAEANRRIQHLLNDVDPALLNLSSPKTAEDTTPDTWRIQ